ncbi:response regulator receiver domain [Rubinisphaera sp.]|uniref:response regulator receiver domain n=1 Tax=Rubinisphaera sp. TaxID=2024857 RepID=UPI000C113351|nr:response regulator receiver domain [Rubinisphaera sp.]MBV10844.1 hypothetical protein [Rubinisphaera sp.]HCS53917.1 hypothetical protein [Planctomycetaceae bacterium]|tara:strand:- start:4840 stop:6621 length:1782 start_codon:yes stop_codon:yes gene_type:complete
MIDTNVLSELTIESFRKNAIRSVLLLDERFPKYHQVGDEKFDTPDAKVCMELYKYFNRQGLLCDIENDIALIKNGISSHIQKSDLLILDLHLNSQNEQDVTDSVEILKSLADSKNFNLVVVYTAKKEIREVGRQLAGSLAGKPLNDSINPEIQDEFTLAVAGIKENHQDIPLTECVDSYLLKNRNPGPELSTFKGDVARELDVKLKPYLNEIVTRLAIDSLKNDYGTILDDGSRQLKAGNLDCNNPWFACESVFVVVANKTETPPGDGALLEVLDEALTDWNPGVVRCLLSEIQNCTTKSGWPFDSLVEKDAITQVGWLYHAKQMGSELGDGQGAIAIRQLTDRVLNSLGNRIASEQSLISLTKKALASIEFLSDPKERIKELCKANGVPEETKFIFPDVLHALNSFLSCEEFREQPRHITTGTIVKVSTEVDVEWWLCVEPACDTIPNQMGNKQFIRLRMLRLKKITEHMKILKQATHSRYIFIEDDGTRIYLDSRDGITNQHDLIDVFVSRDNQIIEIDGSRTVRYWLAVTTNDELKYFEGKATLIAQLRGSNANRFLHEAGYHQSRIGVDFINCTEEDATMLNAPKKAKP